MTEDIINYNYLTLNKEVVFSINKDVNYFTGEYGKVISLDTYDVVESGNINNKYIFIMRLNPRKNSFE